MSDSSLLTMVGVLTDCHTGEEKRLRPDITEHVSYSMTEKYPTAADTYSNTVEANLYPAQIRLCFTDDTIIVTVTVIAWKRVVRMIIQGRER